VRNPIFHRGALSPIVKVSTATGLSGDFVTGLSGCCGGIVRGLPGGLSGLHQGDFQGVEAGGFVRRLSGCSGGSQGIFRGLRATYKFWMSF